MTDHKVYLFLFVAITLLEALFFATVFIGWSVYLYILIDKGFYSSLCTEYRNVSSISSNQTSLNCSSSMLNGVGGFTTNNIGNGCEQHNSTDISNNDLTTASCKEQQEQLNLLYTISTALIHILLFIWGYLSYKFGIWKPKILSMFVFIGGFVMLCFVTPDTALLIVPGFTCIGLGGLGVLTFNTMVASYLPFGTGIYSALLTGAANSSMITFRIVKLLYDNDISEQIAFIGIAVLHFVISTLSTIFHAKFNQWQKQSTNAMQIQISSTQDKVKGNLNISREVSSKVTTLKQSLCQSFTFTLVLWFSILLTTRIMYIGTINERLDDRVPDQVGHFTDVLSYIMFGNVLTSFIPGFVAEWQKRICTGGQNSTAVKMSQQVLALLITSLLAIILSILQFSSSDVTFYIEFVILTVFTSFLFASHLTFVISVYPVRHVSFIYALCTSVGGLISTMQYGLFRWYNMYTEAHLHVGLFITSLTIITLIHPINVFLQGNTDKGKYIYFVINMCCRSPKRVIYTIKQHDIEITKF